MNKKQKQKTKPPSPPPPVDRPGELRNRPIHIPLPFEDAVDALLKVQPKKTKPK